MPDTFYTGGPLQLSGARAGSAPTSGPDATAIEDVLDHVMATLEDRGQHCLAVEVEEAVLDLAHGYAVDATRAVDAAQRAGDPTLWEVVVALTRGDATGRGDLLPPSVQS